MFTTVLGILTNKADIKGHVTNGTRKNEREGIAQNLAIAFGLRFGKFITGYETCF